MATTGRGLPYPVGTDLIVDGDNAIRALAEALDPLWNALTMDSNWLRFDATYRLAAYRVIAGVVTVEGTRLRRLAAGTVTSGQPYTVATLPVGVRPILLEIGPAGTIGVNTNIGPCQWQLTTNGDIQFLSHATTGTQAVGGGWGNHLYMPTMQFRLA